MNHNSCYVTVTVRKKALIDLRPCHRGLTILRSREDRGSVDGRSTISCDWVTAGLLIFSREKGSTSLPDRYSSGAGSFHLAHRWHYGLYELNRRGPFTKKPKALSAKSSRAATTNRRIGHRVRKMWRSRRSEAVEIGAL